MEDVGRGAAFGDLDNDGDTDIVVANDNGPVRVLVNNAGSRSSWIGFRLITASQPERPYAAEMRSVRASRSFARRGPDALAACPRRRQLGVGQRSARARWTGTAAPSSLRCRSSGRAAASRSGRVLQAGRYRPSAKARARGSDFRHAVAWALLRKTRQDLPRNRQGFRPPPPGDTLDLALLHRLKYLGP